VFSRANSKLDRITGGCVATALRWELEATAEKGESKDEGLHIPSVEGVADTWYRIMPSIFIFAIL
jgi:hypothetical protein